MLGRLQTRRFACTFTPQCVYITYLDTLNGPQVFKQWGLQTRGGKPLKVSLCRGAGAGGCRGAAARIALCNIVYTFKPNKEVPPGAKYYITYLLRWSILPPYQFSSLPRTQFPFKNLLHFVVNRAENEDIISKCGCLLFTRGFRKSGWKVNGTRFLGSFWWKLTSEKVEPFFPLGLLQTEVRVPFLQNRLWYHVQAFEVIFR